MRLIAIGPAVNLIGLPYKPYRVGLSDLQPDLLGVLGQIYRRGDLPTIIVM